MIVAGMQTALAEVRNAIRGLAPVEVDAAGLMAALQQLVANTEQRSGVACRFDCPAPVHVDNNDTSTHLFRIAQESLHNAVKHANAAHIVVSLGVHGDELVMRICDDGKGLHGQPAARGGMGLHTMRYRARMIQASLDVASSANQGTAVTCTVKQEVADVASGT